MLVSPYICSSHLWWGPNSNDRLRQEFYGGPFCANERRFRNVHPQQNSKPMLLKLTHFESKSIFENLRFQFSRGIDSSSVRRTNESLVSKRIRAFCLGRGWGQSSSIFLATCRATSFPCKLESVVARITTRLWNLSRNNIQSCKLQWHIPRSRRRLQFL